MSGRLANKVALITGCGTNGSGWGIGKAICVQFAREGAKVFGGDLSLEAAQETRRIVLEEGGDCEVAVADVSDAAQVSSLVQTCIDRYGRIDVLVNNVGIVGVGGPVDYPLERWRRDLEVNVTSMFLTCKYALPHMLKQGGGSIVNIGSIAGIRCSDHSLISYHTSKAAVLGFSRAVAIEHARKNIRSNVIMPGMINTPMLTNNGSIDISESLRKQCPTGAPGEAWDVAHAAAYLASDQSQYVTGTELIVDGGLAAMYFRS